MRSFAVWLRETECWWLPLLHESAFGFRPEDFNALFDRELTSLIRNSADATVRQQLEEMLGFNWVGYIAWAIRQAGYRDQNNIADHLQTILMKFLVKKSQLFQGWSPARHGPFGLRFKRSVFNAIRNIAEKENVREKYLPQAGSIYDLQTRSSGQQADELIQDFRHLIRTRLGFVPLAVFDHRLNGGDTKALIARPELGNPSSQRIRLHVRQIKQLASQFAQEADDPYLTGLVEKAFQKEAATTLKRRTGQTAVQASAPTPTAIPESDSYQPWFTNKRTVLSGNSTR